MDNDFRGNCFNLCLNPVLAIRYVKYARDAFGFMGFFAYPKRKNLMERICRFFAASPLLKHCILGCFFFYLPWAFYGLLDVIKRKKHVIGFLIALIYMSLVYMIVEYRLVYSFIFDDDPNSRDEYFHTTFIVSKSHSVNL